MTDLHILSFVVLGGFIGFLWAIALTHTSYTPFIDFYRELNTALKKIKEADHG